MAKTYGLELKDILDEKGFVFVHGSTESVEFKANIYCWEENDIEFFNTVNLIKIEYDREKSKFISNVNIENFDDELLDNLMDFYKKNSYSFWTDFETEDEEKSHI